MNIVYFSKGIRGSTCLAHILKSGYSVPAVIAVEQEQEIDDLSIEYGFAVLFLDKINSPESVAKLIDLQADLFVLCGYNKIIKKQVIEIPPLGTINLHGGKLPEYRGAAPLNWQIIQGETSGGCAIIYVDEGIDTGDIIAQEIYQITAADTHASLIEKTLQIFPGLLVEVLDQIQSGTVKAVPQNPEEGGYFRRRYPKDSQIDWNLMSAVQVHNLVRAMYGPYPSAFTFLRGTKLEIEKTTLFSGDFQGEPGEILEIRGDHVVASTRDGEVLIELIIVEGQHLAPARFLKVGDILGN